MLDRLSLTIDHHQPGVCSHSGRRLRDEMFRQVKFEIAFFHCCSHPTPWPCHRFYPASSAYTASLRVKTLSTTHYASWSIINAVMTSTYLRQVPDCRWQAQRWRSNLARLSSMGPLAFLLLSDFNRSSVCYTRSSPVPGWRNW